MNMEQYWQEQKSSFLARAKQAADDKELMAQYQMLMEQMKVQALSSFPYDDVLRQQIALLFNEALQGAELLFVRGLPVVVHGEKKQSARPSPMMDLLSNPMFMVVVLGAGLLLSLFLGGGAWKCAFLFAAALALALFNARTPVDNEVATAAAPLQIEYLDGFITRQARLLDQHISDLQLLLQDTLAPLTDVSLDPAALSLCQYVWAFAHSNYPAESALYSAEKLLRQNDIAWVEYAPETRAFFEVMPTQKQSRTIYPALRKISDGTLVVKGQYIESRNS